jgi:integrase
VAGGEKNVKRRKTMEDWVNEYVTRRQALGFRMETEKAELIRFSRYVGQRGKQGWLTQAIVLEWLGASPNASRTYQARRLASLRSFAKYLAIYEPRTEIPPAKLFGKTECRPEPHIYSDQELFELFRTCEKARPPGGLRGRTYRLLFGLLAVTGMRVSEALKLNNRDVDLDNGVLKIRDTKFRKSRLVPLHISTTRALRQYVRARDTHHSLPQTEAFLLSEKGGRLPYRTVQGFFREIRARLGWAHQRGGRAPRIQDLRHSFACRRLLAWYKRGLDVESLIPSLSTYLGHAKVTDTYWYLTGIPELLNIAGRRFEQFAGNGKHP